MVTVEKRMIDYSCGWGDWRMMMGYIIAHNWMIVKKGRLVQE